MYIGSDVSVLKTEISELDKMLEDVQEVLKEQTLLIQKNKQIESEKKILINESTAVLNDVKQVSVFTVSSCAYFNLPFLCYRISAAKRPEIRMRANRLCCCVRIY